MYLSHRNDDETNDLCGKSFKQVLRRHLRLHDAAMLL